MNKPEFDPSKPFEATKPEFDPSQHFEVIDGGQEPSAKQETPGYLGTIAGKFANMGMGVAPIVSGGLEAGGQALGVKGLGGHAKDIGLSEKGPTLDFDTLKKAYQEGRDKERLSQDVMSEEHPYLSPVAGFAGAMAGVPGGIFSAPTLAGRMLKSSGVGAVSGLLNSRADLTKGEFSKATEDAGWGGAIGMAIPPALEEGTIPLAKGIGSAISGPMKSLAETKAFKSLGPYARDSIKAFAKDKVNDIGRTALDEGVVGGVPTSYGGLNQRANNALESKGDAFGDYVNKLSDAEQQLKSKMGDIDHQINPVDGAKPNTIGIDPGLIAKSMREEFKGSESIPGMGAKNKTATRLIDQFEENANGPLSLKDAQNLKTELGQEINWKKLPGADISPKEQVQRSLYGKLASAVDDYADVLDKTVNGPSAEGFQKIRNDYGNLKQIGAITAGKQAREFANRSISPSDYMVGAPGVAYGEIQHDPGAGIIGGLMGVANHIGRKFGNQAMATGLDATANAVMKSPELLKDATPAMTRAIIQNLTQRGLIKNDQQGAR